VTKQEILDFINKAITDERGVPVGKDGKFIDAELDSLATLIVLITIDSKFPILGDAQDQGFEDLDIPNLTMRDLVNKCKSSITSTSTEPSNDQAT
jgi:hypothetical protein